MEGSARTYVVLINTLLHDIVVHSTSHRWFPECLGILDSTVGADTACVLLVQRTLTGEVASSAPLLVFFPVKPRPHYKGRARI